jgi:pimeloyl-ACP methyl ester carboxylesterase
LHLIKGNEHAPIDVVFIHGLDGDAFGTWNFYSEPSWSTWIAQQFPDVSIWSLEYRIKSSRWFGGAMPLHDRAVNVLATVSSELQTSSKIILVCHSYGGLVAKEMIRAAVEAASEYRSFADRIAGFVFLGTPNNGSALAHYFAALNVVLRGSGALTELRQNEPALRQLSHWFRQSALASQWKMRVFFETMNTRGVRVVDESSSDPAIVGVTPIGIDSNHSDLPKPLEPDVRVKRTLNLIQEVVDATIPRTAWQIFGSIVQAPVTARINFQFSNDHDQPSKPQIEAIDPAMDRVEPSFASNELIGGEPQEHGKNSSLPQEDVADALERDFSSRFDRAVKRSLYPEIKVNEFTALAHDVMQGTGIAISAELRRRILLRASRLAAARKEPDEAERLLDAAARLSGPDEDTPARARLASARGKFDDAIQLLRDRTDADSRSTLLSILATARGEEDALSWFADQSLSAADLTSLGVLTLGQIYLQKGDFESSKRILALARDCQLAECPYLYFLRGVVWFASLLPTPDQAMALSMLPLDVRAAKPLPSERLASELDLAADDFRRAIPLMIDLGLREAPRIAEFYLTWCDLLHPVRRDAALEKLRQDMTEPSKALSRVPFAFAYDVAFNPSALLQYLQKREKFGGLSLEEVRAKFSVQINQNDSRGIIDTIIKNRSQALVMFGEVSVIAFEVQALARTGEGTSARLLLQQNETKLAPDLIAGLQTEIAKAEGADPVAEHTRLYQKTKSVEALRALVGALLEKDDSIGIAQYAEQLYGLTKDPRDLSLALKARIDSGDNQGFVRLYEMYPFLRDMHAGFRRHYGWQLFQMGRQREAKAIADELSLSDDRDLNLEIAIALETGEWETLAEPLAGSLKLAARLTGLDLIRAANLAQASGEGPLMDLVQAALEKGQNDANVLLGAYTISMEEDISGLRADAHEWFRQALALSGPDGPIQQFELKDLLAKQTEWNEHTRNINSSLSRAEVPLCLAAPDLRTTLVDLILRNLVRNSTLSDSRRRAAIPLFSGRREPRKTGEAKKAAFDITSLLVLAWLGILRKAFDLFPDILLPAGTLYELFEGRRRIKQFQQSRLRQAIEVRDAIGRGSLKVLQSPSLARDALSQDIGVELAALLRAADAANGIVVRPAPVHRLRSEEREDADISPYATRLADMHAVLRALSDANVIDESSEASARRYFELQDKAWPASACLDQARPVFLDGLALVYLQYTALLDPFLKTFRTVYIHVTTQEEATVLIEHDRNVAEVLAVIDEVRNAVRVANSKGKMIFGPRGTIAGELDRDEATPSTFNILNSLNGAELVVLDDRFLNKEPIVIDGSGARAPIASTLDVIEELFARSALTDDERRGLHYRLRIGGAMLVPVNGAELVAAVRRNRKSDAPEFRAIQDSIDLARLAEMPRFPAEMPWFMGFARGTKEAIMTIWQEEDEERAAVLSEAVERVRPRPEDWIDRWDGNPPPGWILAVRRALLGAMALPIEITDQSKGDAYQRWFEEAYMSETRRIAPESYQRVVDYLRQFIEMPWDDEDEG